MDYYVTYTGLQALDLAAARDLSRANEKRDEWSCRIAMGLVEESTCTVRLLVEKLSAACNELVESMRRWQMVAARLEAGMAKSDGGDFGGRQREAVEAQRVLAGELQQTVAELQQECWLRAGVVEVRKWEGSRGDKMMVEAQVGLRCGAGGNVAAGVRG